MQLETQRIVVTGGAGFLGRYVVDALRARECRRVDVVRSALYDLVDRDEVRQMYSDFAPDIVIHLAAAVGGIGANQQNPARYFYDNLMMGAHLIEEGAICGVRKIVLVGTVCAYPAHTETPFREADIWNGYPEETNAPYGIAKKALLAQAQAYRAQYGLNAVYLLPANLYGPYDNFEPATSHVIPALIRKCVEAVRTGQEEIICWGTGEPTREFLHVRDCARGILAAAEKYNAPDPVNLGTGEEISIRALAEKIARMTGFQGRIVWNAERPNGQMRRRLDVTRAAQCFDFRAAISLDDGLRETIDSYKQPHDNSGSRISARTV